MNETLTQEIIRLRGVGVVASDVARRDPVASISIDDQIDSLVSGTRLLCSPATREIQRSTGMAILRSILYRDLAHQAQRMPLSEADRLTSAFFGLFGDDARFFTNGEFDISADPTSGHLLADLRSWYPSTTATFDTGIVCGDYHHFGIVWVADED